MSSDLQSLLFDAGAVPAFVPTDQWQPILAGQTVPPGLWLKMDIQTGQRLARLMPTATAGSGATAASSNDADELSTSSSAASSAAMCAEWIEAEHMLPDEYAGTASAEEFFRGYTPVFEKYAVFSKRSQCNKRIHLSPRLPVSDRA